ncbi:hypothetical protein [Rhodococcoides fascians]|uniref:hypothetical protein n=1 Tax=Rhodococcoides fascians TaxID=1828 RepID=UPI000523019B|nr:hypothetical protein [Rhodococcus fascians]
MPADATSLIPSNPWLVGLVVVLAALRYVGQLVSEVSETGAKIFGPLGRRWRDRAERQRAREARDVVDLRRQVENLDSRVKGLADKVELYEDYYEYDAIWHRDDNLHGIAEGWVRRPPNHMSLHEFIRERGLGT